MIPGLDKDPVAIGGMGGSGTRVLTEIFLKMGFYMGSSMNGSLDNLWFTFLFKRPEWFLRNRRDMKKMSELCGIFDKAMRQNTAWSAAERVRILETAWNWTSRNGSMPVAEEVPLWRRWVREARWSSGQAASLLFHPFRGRGDAFAGWGWKEPHTHVYLEVLSRYYPGLKYIHVIRHGLDMAYSGHRNQFYHWAQSLFSSDIDAEAGPTPQNMLKFWICVNRSAVEAGRRYLGDRFMILNYDELCRDPERGVDELLVFLGAEDRVQNREELRRIPRRPPSSGRHRMKDLSRFKNEDLEAVRGYGFGV